MITIIGTLCALLWSFVTWLSFGLPFKICTFIDHITFGLFTFQIFEMQHGFHYEVDNNNMPTGIILTLTGIIFFLFFLLIKPIEKNDPNTRSLFTIISFAILFRLILLPGVLIHENDMYRYFWDGQTSLHGINPFKYAPSDLFMYEYKITKDHYDTYNDVTLKAKTFSIEDHSHLKKLIKLRDQNPEFFSRIGHWQVPTIYPPVTQILFMLPAIIQPPSPLIMKALFMLFDIGVIFILIVLLKHFNKNPCLSIIYAWSPLVLFEFANRGHYDAVPIFFTMLAIYLFFKTKPILSAGALALAVLAKFFSGILLPILLIHRADSQTQNAKKKYIFIFGMTLIIFYLPFLFWNHAGLRGVFEGLSTYNQEWSYNSSIFAGIYAVLKKFWSSLTATLLPSKVIVGGIYLLFVSLLVIKKPRNNLDILHRCFLAIGVLFIMNPVGDPWYFCWSIPFLCFFPYRSWILLSGLLPLSYFNFHSDLAIVDMKWRGIPVISWIIYVPFFIYLCKDMFCSSTYLKEKERAL